MKKKIIINITLILIVLFIVIRNFFITYSFSEAFFKNAKGYTISSINIEFCKKDSDIKTETKIYQSTDKEKINEIYNKLNTLEFKNIVIPYKIDDNSPYFYELKIRAVNNENEKITISMLIWDESNHVEKYIHKGKLNENKIYKVTSEFYSINFINDIMKNMTLLYSD